MFRLIGQNAPANADGSYNLLSLDGGGVRGISSMVILQNLMEKIREIENTALSSKGQSADPRERVPVDYFDLAAGTSTGGLIALMLFRLDMTCTQVVQQYEILAKMVFSPKFGSIYLHRLGAFGKWAGKIWVKLKAFFGRSQFSRRPLESAIDKVVASYGIDDEEKQLMGDAKLIREGKGQMFMCATLADRGESILLRNYQCPSVGKPVSTGAQELDVNQITIKEACRATSAAPTYLKEVDIQGLKFWDGGLLNNNPVDQVWDNRYDLVTLEGGYPRVLCIVSVGTGHVDPDEIKKKPLNFIARFLNVLTQTVSFATNTEAKHLDFYRNMRQRNARRPEGRTEYFRFNALTGSQEIGMDDYLAMPKLVQHTKTYLASSQIQEEIDRCAKLLAKIK